MKKILIFCFFIILNTVAMKPDFNNNVIRRSTCMNKKNYIDFVLREIKQVSLDFEAYYSFMKAKYFYIDNMFDDFGEIDTKICEIFQAISKFNLFDFNPYVFRARKEQVDDLHGKWETCKKKSISYKKSFNVNKKKFEKKLRTVLGLFIEHKSSIYSDKESKAIKSLRTLLEENREIKENLYDLTLESIEMKKDVNKNVFETLQFAYNLENQYSEFISDQNQEDQQIQENNVDESEQKDQ